MEIRSQKRSHGSPGSAAYALLAQPRWETELTQIFFYHNAADRITAAAALIGKAFVQKKALLVYAPDAEVASTLDRQLWIQPPTGFIPHVGADSPLAAETPVLIASQLESLPQNERLFNLSAEIPPGFSRFTSVIEVVGRNADELLRRVQACQFVASSNGEVCPARWQPGAQTLKPGPDLVGRL